jgi:hypothetical protein
MTNVVVVVDAEFTNGNLPAAKLAVAEFAGVNVMYGAVAYAILNVTVITVAFAVGAVPAVAKVIVPAVSVPAMVIVEVVPPPAPRTAVGLAVVPIKCFVYKL